MKYYAAAGVFKYSWDQVAQAIWCRYPNPHSTHVLSEDTIGRHRQGDRLYSTRLLTKTNKVPKIAERFIGKTKEVLIVEESVVDREAKTLTTYTRNIGLNRVMSVEEKVVYKPSEENEKWTVCEKQAWISSSLFGVAQFVQTFGIERFKSNATKAKTGFEYVLDRMFQPSEEAASIACSLAEKQASLASVALSNSQTKLKQKAARAKEMATTKAVPVVAKYTGSTAAG